MRRKQINWNFGSSPRGFFHDDLISVSPQKIMRGVAMADKESQNPRGKVIDFTPGFHQEH